MSDNINSFSRLVFIFWFLLKLAFWFKIIWSFDYFSSITRGPFFRFPTYKLSFGLKIVRMTNNICLFPYIARID